MTKAVYILVGVVYWMPCIYPGQSVLQIVSHRESITNYD